MGCGFSSSSENRHLRGSNISLPAALDRTRSAGSGSYFTGTWMAMGSMGLGVSLEFEGPGRRASTAATQLDTVIISIVALHIVHLIAIQVGQTTWHVTRRHGPPPWLRWRFDPDPALQLNKEEKHLQLKLLSLCYDHKCLESLPNTPGVWSPNMQQWLKTRF